jgi:hypothetical protein
VAPAEPFAIGGIHEQVRELTAASQGLEHKCHAERCRRQVNLGGVGVVVEEEEVIKGHAKSVSQLETVMRLKT